MKRRFAVEREKNNQIYYKEYENDYCFPHFHSQIELYFVTDGEMEIMVNNHFRILKAGEAAISLSHDTHQYKTIGRSCSKVFIIPTHLARDFELLINKRRISQPFISHPESVNFINQCIEEINSGKLSELEIKGYIYLVLGVVYKNISFKPSMEAMQSDLSSKLLFYLDGNFKEDVTLTSLAHAMGYSAHYISRYFKSCFGISFKQYINLLRLRNAISLMLLKKHTITYCAFESGFGSIRTFYRTFINEFSKTPKEYLQDMESGYNAENAYTTNA